MDEEREDIAVACYVNGKAFGYTNAQMLRIIVVGELVLEQGPYEADDGRHEDGWPDHFHSLNVYTEVEQKTYPLQIRDQRAYAACERAAISTLRYLGHLPDDDEETLANYG